MVDFHEIWYGINYIQGDLNSIIFNPIASVILKILKFRVVRGQRIFSSSLCVQTGSGANPASCTTGTGGPFPGGKARPGHDADHSPLSSAEVVNE
jgi:hypothetical protein